MTKQLKADIALFLVTIGWGASFLLTKNALAALSTYNFLTIRFFIAFILSSIIFIKKMIKIDKYTFKYGIILGIILFSHYAFQTVGLNYTTVAKSGFVTGFNVILVPVFSALLMKKIPPKKTMICTIMAFVGLGMLTLNKNISGVNIGDIYTFICAVIFAFYIILVGKFTIKAEPISLAIIQLGVVSLLSFITTFAIENPVIPTDLNAWISILILSIVCTSGAYIVQSIAQKFTSPTHTALIYTGEPVFAAIFGYIILGELLNTLGTIGAILILSGMIITELDFKVLLKSRIKNNEQIVK